MSGLGCSSRQIMAFTHQPPGCGLADAKLGAGDECDLIDAHESCDRITTLYGPMPTLPWYGNPSLSPRSATVS